MRLKKSQILIGKNMHNVIEFNYKPTENRLMDEVEINCPGKYILFLSRRNSSLAPDKLKVKLLSVTFNMFYIISSWDEEFQFQVNGEIFETSKINSWLTTKDVENLFYDLVYEEYYKGNLTTALDILINSLKDKYLIRTVIDSFTAKERQRCIDILLKAAHNRKLKLAPKLWVKTRLFEGQLSEQEIIDEAPCFMELLEIFEKNQDKFIPVAPEEYHRIGKKVVDQYNAFSSDDSTRLTADFSDLIFTKDKLNISIRYEIPGYVTINPKLAKAVGFTTNVFKAKLYREQTIIKDGKVNMDRFLALVSKATFNYLMGLGKRDLFISVNSNYYIYQDYSLIEMNLDKIPIINRHFILKNDSLNYILTLCYEQRVAECKKKVIKYFIEKQYNCTQYVDKKYSKKQAELLDAYGLDCNGVYKGIDNKIVEEHRV